MTDSDTSAKCMYYGWSMTPRNPMAKGHLCQRCLYDVQVGGRL